jgi:hypothetical protein
MKRPLDAPSNIAISKQKKNALFIKQAPDAMLSSTNRKVGLHRAGGGFLSREECLGGAIIDYPLKP